MRTWPLDRKLSLGLQVLFLAAAIQHRLQLEDPVTYTESPLIPIEFLCLAATLLLIVGYAGAGVRALLRKDQLGIRRHGAWAAGLTASLVAATVIDAPTFFFAA